MGWCTTLDLDRFLTVAGGYLTARAAENTLLLSAAQAAQTAQPTHSARPSQPPQPSQAPQPPQPPQAAQAKPAAAQATREVKGGGSLFGWWEPPDGSGPRGAFMHDPSIPVLIGGRTPELAASLAVTLSKAGRPVCGVDAPLEAADAFAAAWSQRAGLAVRVHRQSMVYRLTGAVPEHPMPFGGPDGRLRPATRADRELLVTWLKAFKTEVGEFTTAPETTADDLLAYGGAAFWEASGYPVAMATITRPVARTVRMSVVYTPPEHRRNGYAAAVMHAVSRAVLAAPARNGTGQITEVVMITDGNRPDRQAMRLGYEFVGERAVLRFGPATGSIPRVPTGPLPRLRSR